MSRSLLLLASSALRSFAFALAVVGALIAANNMAFAAAQPAPDGLCGTADDVDETCSGDPPCTAPKVCTYVYINQDGKSTSFCGCLTKVGQQ